MYTSIVSNGGHHDHGCHVPHSRYEHWTQGSLVGFLLSYILEPSLIGRVMRLFDFILENMEPILEEWVRFARGVQPPEGDMDVAELRDHAEEMLRAIAADMKTPQTLWERSDKARGNKPKEEGCTAAEIHAAARLASGFSIKLLAAEYRALRASVLDRWLWEHESLRPEEVKDLMRFNEAIDQALAEAISRYSEIVEMEQHVFLSILGHDLRTPLQALSQGAEYLMHARDIDDDVAQTGARMLNSVNRMVRMIDNLQDFTQSRISGEIPISPTETDLSAIAEQVVAEFCLNNPDCTVHSEVKGDCKGHWDPVRMAQIYQNLISNALQYGDRARTVVVTTQGDSAEVVIRVHNEGMPIPEQEQAQLFDLFRRHAQLSEEEKNYRKNLGLGLYIVREIVSAHGGSITLTSTEAEGTDFVIRLPKESARGSARPHQSRLAHIKNLSLPRKPGSTRLH
jgi:signal transduction histidine kinase